MDIAQKLDEVNRSFYARYAEGFAGTRRYGWAGWPTLLSLLPTRPLHVLDLGCGNGRLAAFLARTWCGEAGEVARFCGLDACGALLDQARAQPLPFAARWTPWDWGPVVGGGAGDPPPAAECDWVTLFGVMHHVHGYARRLRLIRWAARALRPGGVLTLSLWDFGADPRWDGKRLEWGPYLREWGADPAALELGDALLGWSGEVDTPRFCHWVSREEEARLVADVNAEGTLEAGQLAGPSDDHNRYWSWRCIGESTAVETASVN